MPGLTIFSGIYCNDEAVVRDISESAELRLITDDEVATWASELSGMPKAKIIRAFSSRTSVFNTFTHEKECSVAYLRMALSTMLEESNFIVSGYSSLLIPRSINHVLRICLISKTDDRISFAKKTDVLSEEDIRNNIGLEDQNCSEWTNLLYSQKDPWCSDLYDMVLPMGISEPAKACATIQENLLKDAVRQTESSTTAVKNFQLSAKVEVALAQAGHNVRAIADNGSVELTIHQQVLMLNRLEDELLSITKSIPGVTGTHLQVSQESGSSTVYRKFNFDMPSKLLLVDDEREFVQTLSERLQMRDMGSVVAYDGKSALELVHNDDPEVMIIDLKMPGIDGMDVLKEVKRIRPHIEIIVLTGHGSEQDRIKCMELGAFDYMQKPVDIDHLSQSIKEAHAKIKSCDENSR